LEHNQSLLREVAQVLVEQEILEGQQSHPYLSRVQSPALFREWLPSGGDIASQLPHFDEISSSYRD
jgi:hypothetical protein